MAKSDSEKRLHNRNIQPTAVRTMVLDFMIEQKAAVSLADLEDHFSRSDRTTLYRTLKTFLEHGLAHQIHDESGSTKYALCAENCTCSYPDDLHVHFYCTGCQNTFCFTEMKIPSFKLPNKFQADHGNFVITGRCADCTA